MVVYCTTAFHEQIFKLQKNNSYINILNDLCDYFSDKDISELHITRDIISNNTGIYSLNKYRIANSSMNKGKSGSYRCISVCLPKENKLFLDTIYPKTGSDGFDNLTKEAYKDCAKRVNEAIKKNTYFEIDIVNKNIKKLK